MNELDDMADGSGALCVMMGNGRGGPCERPAVAAAVAAAEAEVHAAVCAEG